MRVALYAVGRLTSMHVLGFAKTIFSGSRRQCRTSRLSRNQQQQLVVTRECDDPVVSFIVALRPTVNVDINTVEFVYRRLLTSKLSGKAVLLITHDIDEALLISDKNCGYAQWYDWCGTKDCG